MTRIVDDALLARMEAIIAAQGPALAAIRMPDGLSERTIRTALAPLGIDPTRELLAWWGRHDGWYDPDERFYAWEVLPGLQSYSLADALYVYDRSRKLALDNAAERVTPALADPDASYHSSWLPIFATGGMVKIVVECREGSGGGTPVRWYDPSETGQPDHGLVYSESLGTVIDEALSLVEDGTFRFDEDEGTWDPNEWILHVLPSRPYD
jgi:hypothetical protein